MEETIGALDDLARAGKILYTGFSNFPAWLTSRAVTIAELRGFTPLAGVQFEYSLVERTGDREVFPMAEALGIGAALWSPLGGGLLTGKYRRGEEGRKTAWNRLVHNEDGGRKSATVDAVLAVADERGISPAQLAVAWLLERARRSSTGVVPVIGPRSVQQLDDYLAALSIEIDAPTYDRLDQVSRVDLGEPYNKLAENDAPRGGDGAKIRFHPVPTS